MTDTELKTWLAEHQVRATAALGAPYRMGTRHVNIYVCDEHHPDRDDLGRVKMQIEGVEGMWLLTPEQATRLGHLMLESATKAEMPDAAVWSASETVDESE